MYEMTGVEGALRILFFGFAEDDHLHALQDEIGSSGGMALLCDDASDLDCITAFQPNVAVLNGEAPADRLEVAARMLTTDRECQLLLQEAPAPARRRNKHLAAAPHVDLAQGLGAVINRLTLPLAGAKEGHLAAATMEWLTMTGRLLPRLELLARPRVVLRSGHIMGYELLASIRGCRPLAPRAILSALRRAQLERSHAAKALEEGYALWRALSESGPAQGVAITLHASSALQPGFADLATMMADRSGVPVGAVAIDLVADNGDFLEATTREKLANLCRAGMRFGLHYDFNGVIDPNRVMAMGFSEIIVDRYLLDLLAEPGAPTDFIDRLLILCQLNNIVSIADEVADEIMLNQREETALLAAQGKRWGAPIAIDRIPGAAPTDAPVDGDKPAWTSRYTWRPRPGGGRERQLHY